MNSAWRRAAAGANLLRADGSVGVTIFEEMTAAALDADAVNLGQGAPDESGPAWLLDAARANIAAGFNQYAPGRGFPALREAIAAHQQRFYDYDVDASSQVLVTTGATEALAASILALCSPGDEVIVLDPFYDSYGAMIAVAGAKQVSVPLTVPEFSLDLDALRAAFNERTRMLILNNPHNPTGRVFTREELQAIVALAHEFDVLLLADDVYEHLVFDGRTHIPIASLDGAFERTLTVSSAGKTFSVTGWKVGWVSGPEHLITAVRSVKQFLTYSSGTPFQPAIAEALCAPDAFFADAAADLAARRDLLFDGLTSLGFAAQLPEAGYFVVADAAPLGVTDAATYCRELPLTRGVAAIPVSALATPNFRGRTLVRFAFCKRRDSIKEALRRLGGGA